MLGVDGRKLDVGVVDRVGVLDRLGIALSPWETLELRKNIDLQKWFHLARTVSRTNTRVRVGSGASAISRGSARAHCRCVIVLSSQAVAGALVCVDDDVWLSRWEIYTSAAACRYTSSLFSTPQHNSSEKFSFEKVHHSRVRHVLLDERKGSV